METVITQSDSKFSFRRVGMVAGFYYPIFKKQIWLYPLVSLAFGIATFVLQYYPELSGFYTFFGGLMSIVLALMFYWSPCIMGNEGREIEVLLPALWSEKAVFILGYFFVAIPTLVYIPYILVKVMLMTFFIPQGAIVVFNPEVFSMSIADVQIGLSSIDALVAMSTALFIMMNSRRRSFAKAAVLSIVTHFCTGIIAGIIVVARLWHIGFDRLEQFADKNIVEGSVNDINGLMGLLGIESLIVITTILCLAYVALMISLIIRSIRKFQI